MNTHARDAFGRNTTADEVLDGIDLTGKLALVTGGSSGLGAETARALASKGARVVITARDLAKAESVVSDIKSSTGNNDIAVEGLELASFDSIRAFAKRFLETYGALDILINNAGVMACPEGKTENGFERQFGTNHLGHFLMTTLIAPALVEGGPARVVSVSSAGHRFSPVVFDDVNYENRDYEKWQAYGQSKTANALFAVGLNARLKDHGVEAFSIHPGAIPTDLARHMSEEELEGFRQRADSGEMRLKTVESGAATQTYAATAPELIGQGGAYLADCRICEVNDTIDGLSNAGMSYVSSYAVDPEAAERLWALSEEATGARLAF